MLPFILLSVLAAKTFAQDIMQYNVINNCPATMNLYINGQFDSTINTGASEHKILGVEKTSMYTDLNGGSQNGTLSTRAEFNGEDNTDEWYYIVKNPNNFNTGISISTTQTPANGLCVTVECTDASCTTAFTDATAPTSFADETTTAPAPPLYECPFVGFDYNVTFCPGGSFPGGASV